MTSLHPPKVTIAVPTYNRAELLDRALTTLSEQTLADMEIVVCDNASSDATPEIVERHLAADSRFRYHQSATNVGAFKNFELGLLLARGEYFMWAADDDLWEPELAETLAGILDADPDCVLVCAEARYMTVGGTYFDFFPEGRALRERPVRGSLPERLRALIDGHYGNVFYGLYRRTALLRILGDSPVGTAFSVYGATTVGAYGPQSGVNEGPLLLQVASRGAIEVIDSCLWAKTTTPNAYRDAHEEARRRDRARQSRPVDASVGTVTRGVAAIRWRLRGDAAYHRAVMADLTRSIRSLDISFQLKQELRTRCWLRLLRHFVNFEWRQALAARSSRSDDR